MNTTKTLVEEFGLNDLPQEEQEVLLAEFGEILFTGVLKRAWNDLDLDKQDALGVLLKELEEHPEDSKRDAALAQFLEEHVPNLKSHVDKELEKFRQQYQESLSALE